MTLVNIFAHANTLQDYAASGEELNPKKIKFLAQMLTSAHIDVLLTGPLAHKAFKDDFSHSLNVLASQCDTAIEMNSPIEGKQRGEVVTANASDGVSLAWVEYNATMKDRAIQSVLHEIFDEPFYKYMRVTQKIAYHVDSHFINEKNAALVFTVQSSKRDSQALTDMIELFIRQYAAESSTFQKQFEAVKKRMLLNPMIKPSKLSKESVWIRGINCLGFQADNFMSEYLKEVEKVTVEDLQEYVVKQLTKNKVIIE